MQSKGIAGFPASSVHLTIALATIAINFFVNWLEFRALERNGEIVDRVLAEVRKIRIENGLAVDG